MFLLAMEGSVQLQNHSIGSAHEKAGQEPRYVVVRKRSERQAHQCSRRAGDAEVHGDDSGGFVL